MKRRMQDLAALLLAIALAPAASAGDSDTTAVSRTLRYDTGELRNPTGARRVYQQIRLIAGQVCDVQGGAGLERKLQYADCVRVTVEGAVTRLDAPLVTALHAGRAAASVAWAAR